MTDTFQGTNCLVDVRGLVMVRDDNSGGWVPMGGGGLSHVSVRKCAIPGESDQLKEEYFVIGKRITDDSVVLSCPVKKDLEYYKVMPTFHHWKLGDKRFGLTFQTVADARAFDRGLRIALSNHCGGRGEKPPPHTRKKRASELEDDEEDEIFMTLELPVTGVDSRSASDFALRESPQATPIEQAAQMSHFFNPTLEPQSPTQSATYDYLQLTTGQELVDPDAEGTKLVQQDSDGSAEKKGAEASSETATKPSTSDKKKSARQRCRYCHEIYVEEDNRRGACEYAPDCMRTTVEEVACIRAARCMTYHCMSDEEGEFAQHPCACNCEDDGYFRWIGLAILSIFVPCLCLYPPLRICHWCCLRVGVCGGRHRSAS